MRKTKCLLIAFTIIVLSTIIYATAMEATRKQSWFEQFKTEEEVKVELLKKFPVGSKLEPLKKFLLTQANSSEEIINNSQFSSRHKIQYYWNPVITEWVVVVSINNDNIQDITIFKYLTGP